MLTSSRNNFNLSNLALILWQFKLNMLILLFALYNRFLKSTSGADWTVGKSVIYRIKFIVYGVRIYKKKKKKKKRKKKNEKKKKEKKKKKRTKRKNIKKTRKFIGKDQNT